MSATAPASMTPPLPPTVPPATSKPGSPLAGFFIDLGIAAIVLFGLSLMAGLVWGVYRGLMVGYAAAKSGDTVGSAADLTAQLGQPGALAQILMALIATGGAALLLYFWRRRGRLGNPRSRRDTAPRPARRSGSATAVPLRRCPGR